MRPSTARVPLFTAAQSVQVVRVRSLLGARYSTRTGLVSAPASRRITCRRLRTISRCLPTAGFALLRRTAAARGQLIDGVGAGAFVLAGRPCR